MKSSSSWLASLARNIPWFRRFAVPHWRVPWDHEGGGGIKRGGRCGDEGGEV